MIIAFQIILLILIPLSFLTMFADYERKEHNRNLAFICVGSMIAFCISIMFFD